MSEQTLPRTTPVIDGAPRTLSQWSRRTRPYGPATIRRQWRTRAVYLVVCILGLLPYVLGGSPALRAFGLGLLFPGAGMFYPAGGLTVPINLIWFVGTMALFSIAFVIWFGTGNILAPVAVWVGAAFIGSLRATDPGNDWFAVLVIVGVLVFSLYHRIRAEANLRASKRETEKRNAILAEVEVSAGPVSFRNGSSWVRN